jgi:hypothetical protein
MSAADLATNPIGILLLGLTTVLPTILIVRKASKNIIYSSDFGYVVRLVVTIIGVMMTYAFALYSVVGLFSVIVFVVIFVIVWKDTVRFNEPQWYYHWGPQEYWDINHKCMVKWLYNRETCEWKLARKDGFRYRWIPVPPPAQSESTTAPTAPTAPPTGGPKKTAPPTPPTGAPKKTAPTAQPSGAPKATAPAASSSGGPKQTASSAKASGPTVPPVPTTAPPVPPTAQLVTPSPQSGSGQTPESGTQQEEQPLVKMVPLDKKHSGDFIIVGSDGRVYFRRN